MTNELDFDITIIEVYELNNQLRVEVETPYGIENIGCSLDDKYLDPLTEKPKWMRTVKKLLMKKYKKENRKKKPIQVSFIGKKMNIADFGEDKISGTKKRLINSLGFNIQEVDQILAQYPNLDDIRKDVIKEKKLPFIKKINDKLTNYYGGTSLGFDTD